MRRNGYLCTSGVKLDTVIRFPAPISVQNSKSRRFGDDFRRFFHFICWMSAIFPLPVCLTYWSRKYTTRVDPHVDNSHLVWSCDLVTLTFDLLALSSWRAWRVMGDQPLKTLSLSVLELLVITFPVGYHWKCVRATGYAPNHVTGEHWVEDHYIFLESPIPICLFTIDFHRRHYNTLALLCECDNCTNNYWNLTATFKNSGRFTFLQHSVHVCNKKQASTRSSAIAEWPRDASYQ